MRKATQKRQLEVEYTFRILVFFCEAKYLKKTNEKKSLGYWSKNRQLWQSITLSVLQVTMYIGDESNGNSDNNDDKDDGNINDDCFNLMNERILIYSHVNLMKSRTNLR